MLDERVADRAPVSADLRDRALGAIYGLAIGDALGMPTQLFSRAQIAELYGDRIETFHPGPPQNEISRGMPAGTVTDDTDQAMIIGLELVRTGGDIDHAVLAESLMSWERAMIAKGSLDLLGPSTKRALSHFAEGEIEAAGRWGDTNGAAMRIAPVGVATPATPLNFLCERVARTSELTHNTSVAIAAASAIAAAVSAGLDGSSTSEMIQIGVAAARLGAQFGGYTAGADIARRIAWAVDLVRGRNVDDALDDIYELVGTGPPCQEAVPAAFAIVALVPDDPWLACRLAAGLGGDTDTVAAMVGAILGARHGRSRFPADAVGHLEASNPDLDLTGMVEQLLDLRQATDRVARGGHGSQEPPRNAAGATPQTET